MIFSLSMFPLQNATIPSITKANWAALKREMIMRYIKSDHYKIPIKRLLSKVESMLDLSDSEESQRDDNKDQLKVIIHRLAERIGPRSSTAVSLW